MEINVLDESKTVEVWLTREEKRDESLCESLKPLYRRCKERKYLVAVFESGEGELPDATSELLFYNRRRMAELEVQSENRS